MSSHILPCPKCESGCRYSHESECINCNYLTEYLSKVKEFTTEVSIYLCLDGGDIEQRKRELRQLLIELMEYDF